MTPAERARVEELMRAPEPDERMIADVVAAATRAGGIEYARARAARHQQEAEAELEILPPSPARDALRACVTYVTERRR